MLNGIASVVLLLASRLMEAPKMASWGVADVATFNTSVGSVECALES